MKTICITIGLCIGLISVRANAEPIHVVCTPSPIVCTSFVLTQHDRFDSTVQHFLVRQQLESLPTGWRIVNFYIPYPERTRAVEESQIRYLDQLNQRSKTEAAAAEVIDTSEATDSESQ